MKIGKKLTGYEKAGDVYVDYGEGSPLFGHGPDFGYWYLGAIWYGDEIWNGARYRDYDNDGTTDQADILRWDEEENGGEGFIEGSLPCTRFTEISRSEASIPMFFPRIHLQGILSPG
jgi:hypothetical protein